MPRRALARFFERVVLASLPLAVSACHVKAAAGDMAVGAGDPGASADMAADDTMASDLGRPGRDLYGLTGDLADVCDTIPSTTDPPPAVVSFPASDLPDGGFATPCQAGMFCTSHCPGDRYTTCCGPNPTDGGYQLTCILDCSGPGPGRRPAGLVAAASAAPSAVGRYFADAAHLEAASVHAFRRLGRELQAHRAPRALVARAGRALRDEVRHARAMRRLARRHGATPAPVRVTTTPPRSLEAIATENVVEGCVRETFAALLAVYQARAAADPTVRATMAAIAPDETRHAELAWAVHAWAQRRLDRAARRRVIEARAAAVAALAHDCANIDATLAAAVGLPGRAQTAAMIAAASRELWQS